MPPVPDLDQPVLEVSRRFAADPDAVRENLARLFAEPPLSQVDPQHLATAELVLAEVLNNVAEHAYADQAGEVEVTLTLQPDSLDCRVVDGGRPMPGGKLPEGRLPGTHGVDLMDLPEGGFGWHLIRELTSGLDYQRHRASNILVFSLPFDR